MQTSYPEGTNFIVIKEVIGPLTQNAADVLNSRASTGVNVVSTLVGSIAGVVTKRATIAAAAGFITSEMLSKAISISRPGQIITTITTLTSADPGTMALAKMITIITVVTEEEEEEEEKEEEEENLFSFRRIESL